MLTKTLADGLDQYAIGGKLRRLRLKKGIGLIELGQHSGLSPAMISKIERGRLYPTLPTLLRLALVFSVGLEYFFNDRTEEPTFAIVRKDDRLRFPSTAKDNVPVSYYFESLDFAAVERSLTAYLAHFEPLAKGKDDPPRHTHDGQEFLHLINGKMDLYYDDRIERLNAGDSVYFDGSVPHGYARVGQAASTGLVVTVP